VTLAVLADRYAAAAFMLAAAALFARPMPVRHARTAWIVLIVLGAGYDLALNLQPVNFPNSNFDHYYLGAKYPVAYAETYRLIHAGQGRPQIGMRDLEHPANLVHSGSYEQRAYYIDLLRAARVSFDPLAPLDTLAARARDSGAIEAEARRILASDLPANRIAEYRRDVRTAQTMGQGPHLTLDYGYNGSPLYGLVRQMDPTLHLPFGRLPALAGLAWQLLGVVLIALLAGAALGLSTAERLAVAALILVCPDFANFGMAGLVFTELWVPVVIAAWALRRGRHAVAGTAIAFAGLLKLFPFLLALAAAVPLLRSFVPGASGAGAPAVRRRAFALLAAGGVATLGLGLLSVTSGRTWTDFLHKIAVEFQSGLNVINSVSAAAALATLGVPDRSPLFGVVSLAALVPLTVLFWGLQDGGSDFALPRRSLVLIAATGWLVKSWLNYYVIVPFMLLPLTARRHRVGTAAIATAMAAAYLLPEFDDASLLRHPALHLGKLAPCLVAPAWLVWLELRENGWGRPRLRWAALAAVLLALATGEEIWRGHEIQRLAARADETLANHDAAGALESYDRWVRLSPRDATPRRRRAIALVTTGRLDEALADFARAVALAPGDAAAHDDYGRALLMSGRTTEAAEQLEAARALTPCDVQILFQLARIHLAQGRRPEAMALIARAHELAPGEAAISEAYEQLGAR